MTRTEMITEIAKQAYCSKRLVRKKIFEISSKFKKDHHRHYKRLKFNQAFLDKNTNWQDWQELHDKWKNDKMPRGDLWRTPNTFEVVFFPTGCSVLFRVEEVYEDDDYTDIGTCGARLYNY